jgi:type II secretory pathway component PulF
LSDNPYTDGGNVGGIPLASQLGQAVRAGLPLESGLRALAEQTNSWRTRRALLKLSERLEQGVPLTEAMRDSSAFLPNSLSALVEAGMETGRLDTVMQYSVEQSQRATSLRQQIWLALVYPLFLLWFSMMICAFILLTILPQFKQIFDGFGTELPGLTAFLLRISSLATQIGWGPILLAFPILIITCILFFTVKRSKFANRWAASIPLLGAVFRLATLSEFCQILAILLESRLPFSKALRFAAAASDDKWLSRRCQLIAHDMDAGATPDAAAMLAGLPNGLQQVFRHASSERTIVESLRGLSDLYAAQCSASSRLVTRILEPFVVVVVMGNVGITAIALFLPLIKLLNDLS